MWGFCSTGWFDPHTHTRTPIPRASSLGLCPSASPSCSSPLFLPQAGWGNALAALVVNARPGGPSSAVPSTPLSALSELSPPAVVLMLQVVGGGECEPSLGVGVGPWQRYGFWKEDFPSRSMRTAPHLPTPSRTYPHYATTGAAQHGSDGSGRGKSAMHESSTTTSSPHLIIFTHMPTPVYTCIFTPLRCSVPSRP